VRREASFLLIGVHQRLSPSLRARAAAVRKGFVKHCMDRLRESAGISGSEKSENKNEEKGGGGVGYGAVLRCLKLLEQFLDGCSRDSQAPLLASENTISNDSRNFEMLFGLLSDGNEPRGQSRGHVDTGGSDGASSPDLQQKPSQKASESAQDSRSKHTEPTHTTASQAQKSAEKIPAISPAKSSPVSAQLRQEVVKHVRKPRIFSVVSSFFLCFSRA
jgi:hypothetical protein